MADIELVIKIDEERYKRICSLHDNMIFDCDDPYVAIGIKNGQILPKGHGRLIDADAFERRCMFDSNIEDMQDVIYALRDYKPIIEADKTEREYKE